MQRMSYQPGALTALLNPGMEAAVEAVERLPPPVFSSTPTPTAGKKRKEPEPSSEGEEVQAPVREAKRKRKENEKGQGKRKVQDSEEQGTELAAQEVDSLDSQRIDKLQDDDGAVRRLKQKEKEEKKKGKKKSNPMEDERLPCTVFVGNVPVTATHKEVAALFVPFCSGKPVVRFRCVPREHPKIPPKAAIITGRFHPERDSMTAYVVLDSEEHVQQAVQALNGTEFKGKVLRVDAAASAGVYDSKRSVFVGNLAFDASEDELRQHFVELGLDQIEGIRIVRDRATSAGKGFAFVLFKDAKMARQAVAANGTEFKGRALRVTRAADPEKLKQAKGKASGKGQAAYEGKHARPGAKIRKKTGGKKPNKPTKKSKKSTKESKSKGKSRKR